MELAQKIRALPEPVQDYLYGEELTQANAHVIERHGIEFEAQRGLMQLLQRILVREVALSDLEKEAVALLGADGDKAKALARDIAGYCFLPLDHWLADVSSFIRRLGGDVAEYPALRIKLTEKTREEAAAEVVESASEASSEAATMRVKDRMQDVVSSFLAGIRTEPQTFDVLTRAEKIGGVGLSESTAKQLLSRAKEEVRAVVITAKVPGVPEVAQLPEAAALTTPAKVPATPAKSKDDFSTIKPEDEAEIKVFKESILPAKGIDKADETARRIESSVNEIYAASGLVTDDEAMAKRVKTVVGNRLRDVRDQMETLEVMVQPKELGGLGLSQDAARALLNAIQTKLRAVHDEHAVQATAEKTEWVEKEREKKVESEIRVKQGDQTDLERLYQSIVSKSPKAARNAPPAPVPVALPVPSAPSVAKAPENLPIATTNPIPPELRAPAVVALPQPSPAVPVAATPMPPLTIVRPTPGITVAPQVQPGPDAPKPRMDDVKPMARLTGPVEELRAITIVDFRRLSKDPAEACVKIKDKLDLLAEQSYTRRTEAIAAWGASEPVRTYLELMGEGLNGTPLKDAVAARQAAKRPYLTPEEFQAVAALSRQLRY